LALVEVCALLSVPVHLFHLLSNDMHEKQPGTLLQAKYHDRQGREWIQWSTITIKSYCSLNFSLSVLRQLMIMEVVVTTGAIRRAKLQSNVATNEPTPNFLQAGCLSCRPTNSVEAQKTFISKGGVATDSTGCGRFNTSFLQLFLNSTGKRLLQFVCIRQECHKNKSSSIFYKTCCTKHYC